jgi:RNA polymerase sigma factor (sigma-70 family)
MSPQLMIPNRKDKFLSTIEDHKKIIYKIVNSYCRNKEDRKDLEQEIIIQLWNSFEKYDDRYKYSTWMYRIALNVAISFYRKEKKRPVNYGYGNDNLVFSIETDHESETDLDNNIKILQGFINSLNELNKALMLLYLDEKSHEEIAEIMGISKSNVGTKISRIKLKLIEEFKKIKDHGSR